LCELRMPAPRPVPRFPAVARDLALWFGADVAHGAIEKAICRLASTDARLKVLREVRLFDVYRPSSADSSNFAEASANALLNKEKSLAFRVVLQDTQRTLSEAEVDAAIAALIQALAEQFGARIRD